MSEKFLKGTGLGGPPTHSWVLLPEILPGSFCEKPRKSPYGFGRGREKLQFAQGAEIYCVFYNKALCSEEEKKNQKTAHEGHSPRTQTYYKTDLFIGLENVFPSHILPPNQQGSRVITMDYWLKD